MIKNIFLTLIIGAFANGILAQNSITIKAISKEDKEPLIGASVYIKNTTNGATTDLDGLANITNITNGKHTIVVSFIGFETIEKEIQFPIAYKVLTVELQEDESTLDTVIIASTRSKRTIGKTPTRVEVIGGEELGEKNIMNSANIAMLLKESTGIQMQQTSANSANQSIRIQGLDGRFTQLLKDGIPMFGGFSSGLSIMQIPPLDLKQVEIIKGSSSTLYGGGAIAGLVNLISKQPKDEREFSLMFDKTSRNGNTLNAFYSERFNKIGIVLYGSGHVQKATDVNEDHFSDIPKVRSISFNPSFFYYPNDQEQFKVGLTAGLETRIGGDIAVINNNSNSQHSFFEENNSTRYAFNFSYKNDVSESNTFNLKNSISYFKRDLLLPNYQFKGEQLASFTEATYTTFKETSDWVFGTNLITENFKEDQTTILDRSYNQLTFGGFFQNNWNIKDDITLESGLRTDFNNNYGAFLLPRISLFFQFNEAVTSRIGSGFGYKIPTIFTEDSELRSFRNIIGIDIDNFKAEKSIGFNADINFTKRVFNESVSVSFNQLFFYTKLRNTLILEKNNVNYSFKNSKSVLNSYGFESNLKLKYKDFVLFTNYAFNNVKINSNQKALTPKHSIGAVLMYEVHEKWRVGYEAYYKSSQFRNNGTETPNYWTMGLMAMRTFNTISVYANFENFTDTKQSNYQSMIEEPHSNPSFTDIWAPTDGFIFNAGVLIKL